MQDSTRGRLLVAAPALLDDNFNRSVVFMLEHNHDGAVGVILNRPSGLPVSTAIESWADQATEPAVLFLGGPVSPSSVIALASRGPEFGNERWSRIVDDIGTVDLELSPADVPGLQGVRLFAGYAGWTGGQLEAELVTGSWFVVDAESNDIQTDDPQELWWGVCARQHGELRRLAHYPHNPRHN